MAGLARAAAGAGLVGPACRPFPRHRSCRPIRTPLPWDGSRPSPASHGPRGDVARYYAAITDILRDYLEAHGIPARERTTTELRWALPPVLLSGSGRRRFEELFGAADLVKFAHWRPDGGQAEAFLHGARELLTRWHAAREIAAADQVRAV